MPRQSIDTRPELPYIGVTFWLSVASWLIHHALLRLVYLPRWVVPLVLPKICKSPRPSPRARVRYSSPLSVGTPIGNPSPEIPVSDYGLRISLFAVITSFTRLPCARRGVIKEVFIFPLFSPRLTSLNLVSERIVLIFGGLSCDAQVSIDLDHRN